MNADPLSGIWSVSGVHHGLTAFLVCLAAYVLFQQRHSRQEGKRVLVALSAFLGARYLIWRAVATLNHESTAATVISLTMFLAELYGYSAMLLFYFQVLPEPVRQELPPADEKLPTVDILVPIYDEPAEILRKTLIGCNAIDYPEDLKKVYVLDDGARPEIRSLAEKMGCEYLAREKNVNAKAGNVNHGLARSSGELVLILDCDHIPVRSFLQETVGYFQDPKVAIVQTPHHFYNKDAFQRNHQLEDEVVNEQDLFFFVIQPGRDRANAAFFAGSSGVFRRKPLMDIGGIQVDTICEDLHTSMVLHSKGWKSVYVDKILSAGLSPESFRGYIKQRQRWTRGGLQIFLLDNPLWKRGLTFLQRVHYIGAVHYFWSCVPRIVYLAGPLSYFLADIVPVAASVPKLGSYFLPYYLCSLWAFQAVSGIFRAPFWSDVYETATCFGLTKAVLKTLVKPRENRFEVTPKGERFDKKQLEWSYVLPHATLLTLLLIGLEVGAWRLFKENGPMGPILVTAAWTVYNIIVLIAAIIVAEQRPSVRSAPRFRRNVRCEVLFDEQAVLGRTVDLSETGASLALMRHVVPPESVRLRLIGPDNEIVELDGEVNRTQELWTGRGAVAVRFKNLDEEGYEGLVRVLFTAADSWHNAHQNVSGALDSLLHVATALPRRLSKDARRWRLKARERKKFACELVADGKTYKGVTSDIGAKSMRMRLERNGRPPAFITVRIHHDHDTAPPLTLKGWIMRRMRSKGNPDSLVVRFLERKDAHLLSLISHHG